MTPPVGHSLDRPGLASAASATVGLRGGPPVSPRQVVVLGGGEPWAPDLVRAIPTAAEVSFTVWSPEPAWTAALEKVEAADVVVVALSATTISDPAWSALAEHAVAWHTGLVVVVGDDTPLARWPAWLRDAMPTTVDLAGPAWPAELAHVVAELEPSRPDPWTPPVRPPIPSGAQTEPAAPWPAPRDEHGPLDDASDDVRMDEDVQFTVYRPSAVPVDRWSWLLVFAHTSQGSAEEPDPLAEVRRQAEGVLGAQASAYGALSADSTGPLRRGSTLLVEPWLEGATFNPPTVELQWEEPVHRADFRFRFGADAPSIARGGVRIFVGSGRRGRAHPERARRRAPGGPAAADERAAVPQGVRVLLPCRHRGGRGRGQRGPVARRRVPHRLPRPPQRRGLAAAHRRADRRRRRLPALLVVERAAVALRAGGVPPRIGAATGGLHPPGLLAGPVAGGPGPGPPPDPDPPAALLPPRRVEPGRGAAAASGGRAPAAWRAAGSATRRRRAPGSGTAATAASAGGRTGWLAHRRRRPHCRRPDRAPPDPRRRAGPVGAWPTWTAVGAAAVLVAAVGVGVVQAGGHEDRASSPATTRVASTDTEVVGAPPTTVSGSETSVGPTVPGSDDATFDRAVAYLGALAVAKDPSCRLTAANPTLGEVGSLEEIGVDCTLTVAGSGAPIQFRSIVLRPGVTVQRYLDGLAAAPGLQVVGGSLADDPDGPYLDLSGRLQDGRTYSCRAWGQAPVAADTSAVAIACGATMADVVDFWRLHKS